MGCDLDDVLETLQALKNMADYWFQCRGEKHPLVDEKINDLELLLRQINEGK